jgi:hypothetical protein
MTIRGLQRLLMILGGKVAAEFREIVEGVFTRYMAGDTSLIEEIRDNAASDAPVNVMARTALEQEPVTLDKRKQIDELDFAERAENLRRTRVETVCKFAEVMSMLDTDWKDDTRLVQQTKDFCKNGLLTQQLLLTDGEPTPTLYIADVARELEVKLQPGDTSVIGKTLKRLYQDKHGSQPTQHLQFVDGAERKINVYTEADRDVMEEAIKEHFCKRSTRSQSRLAQPKERISTFFEAV